MAITQHIDLNIIPNSAPVIVHVDQYDHGTGRIIASLYEDSTPYTPTSASVYVQGTKPDGTFFVSSDGVTLEGNVVTADLTKVMTQVAGQVRIQFVVTEQTGRTGTFVFWLDVQASALPDNSQMSESDISMVEEAIETMQEYVSDSAESAQEAATSAAAASQSKEAAEAAATSATGLAVDSEAFARGTRNGVPVEPGDEAYHDNAKYWAEYAESVTDVHPMTASTLGIGQPDGYTAEVNTPGVFSAIGTTIVATVNPGGTAYTSDWLVDADDNVITPDSRRQYRVTVEGKTSLWWWTGTEYKQLAGGGHVVTKTDGTPMPQRANLELAGAKLTDESASDTTKVEFYYEYPTLAAAQADIANIPEGARVIIKEADYVGQIDNALSLTSNNPVQNKVVTAAINDCKQHKLTGTTRAQLEIAVSNLTFDELCHSVLVVNGSNILTFYDWTASRTRWARFAPENTTNALYTWVMVNSSVDGVVSSVKTTTSYNQTTEAITSWTLYY